MKKLLLGLASVGIIAAGSFFSSVVLAGTNGFANIHTYVSMDDTTDASGNTTKSGLQANYRARVGWSGSSGDNVAHAEFQVNAGDTITVRDLWIGTKAGPGTIKMGYVYTPVDTGAWGASGYSANYSTSAFVTGWWLQTPYRIGGINYSADFGAVGLGIGLGFDADAADDKNASNGVEAQPAADVIAFNLAVKAVPNLKLNIGHAIAATKISEETVGTDKVSRVDKTDTSFNVGYAMGDIKAELGYLAQAGLANLDGETATRMNLVFQFKSYYLAYLTSSFETELKDANDKVIEYETETRISLGGTTDLGDGLSINYGYDSSTNEGGEENVGTSAIGAGFTMSL